LLLYKSNSDNKIKEQIILEGWKSFLIMLAPITPHITEELWKLINKNQSLFMQKWPSADEQLLKNKKIIIAIQINGKLKNTIEIDQENVSNKEMQESKALNLDNIKRSLQDKTPKKIIVIPGKVVNIVT